MFKPRHIAQVCREGMGALNTHIRNTAPATHWDQLTDRQRKMSVAVVNFILATPEATPETCHQLWTEKMQHEEGYVYGEFRDDTQKTHPDLVPFAELNPFAVAGYALSIGIVRGLQDIAHRYENCAPRENVATPPPPIAAALEPVVAPLVTAMEETLSQIESTPGDVAIYGVEKPTEETIDKPTEETIDKVVNDAVDKLEPAIDKAVNDAVDGLSEPAVDVQ